MNAFRNNNRSVARTPPAWHRGFLLILPKIHRQVAVFFRGASSDVKEEMIAAVTANALVAYLRLIEQGRAEQVFPSALARYGILQVLAGRSVGGRWRIGETLSPTARRQKGFTVESLDHFDPDEDAWREIAVEDKRASPAEVAAIRIDFGDWLRRLPARVRDIAAMLAGGESTSDAARRFGISAARVSQLRTWLRDHWLEYQGELPVQRLRLAAG
jgi:hypothetical protein